jgi:PKD repeat protein
LKKTWFLDLEAPKAVAGENRTVLQGTNITFNASASYDNVGIVNYTWELTDGVSVVKLFGVAHTHYFAEPGIYPMMLNATDSAGNFDTDLIIIIVQETTPPVAIAGSDRNVSSGEVVVFDGSASTDNVGIVNYTWNFTYNGTIVTLHGVSPSFQFWTPGNYTVTLTVRDAAGNYASDTVLIIVNPVTIPSDVGYIWIIILVIALVTAALLGLRMLKVKKPGVPKTEENAAEKPTEENITIEQRTEPQENE